MSPSFNWICTSVFLSSLKRDTTGVKFIEITRIKMEKEYCRFHMFRKWKLLNIFCGRKQSLNNAGSSITFVEVKREIKGRSSTDGHVWRPEGE